MKKKFLFLLIILFIPFSIYALEYPSVNSKIVEVYDLNDQKILYEKDSNKVSSIASLTKIASTIIAIENIDDLDCVVTITSSMLKDVDPEASVAGLKVGDKLTYRDLLYASMIPSGADATNALAILTSGSINNFVSKMNSLATKLNLTNTHFVNVTGLDISGHESTADDVRKILEYALNNPIFRDIFTTKQYIMKNGKVLKSTLYKYNAIQSDIEKIIGSKTGYTGDAGYCLAALSNINGHEILTILINAQAINNKYYNIVDTISLINYMSDNYKEEILVEKNTLIKTLPVNLSKIEIYDITADSDIKKYLSSDYDINNLNIKYNGLEELNFRNKKDDKIGTISYYYDGELLYQQDVILNQKIELSIIKLLKKYYYLIIIFVILMLILKIFIQKILMRRKIV